MVRSADPYETDPNVRRQLDRLFHGPGADHCTQTVPSVQESGSCLCPNHAGHSAGVHHALADTRCVNRKANHSMRVHTPQICEEQTIAHFLCVLLGYIQLLQHRATEPVYIFCTIAPLLRHGPAFLP